MAAGHLVENGPGESEEASNTEDQKRCGMSSAERWLLAFVIVWQSDARLRYAVHSGESTTPMGAKVCLVLSGAQSVDLRV